MITGDIFAAEILRIRRSDISIGAMGLHVPQWMLGPKGVIPDDRLSELFGEANKRLGTDEVLVEFCTWLLLENAAGRVRYFPKLSEFKVLIHQFEIQSGRKERGPVSPRISRWIPPPVDVEAEQQTQEMLAWWNECGAVRQDEIRKEIIGRLGEAQNDFAVKYLQEKSWENPGVMVRAHLLEYYRQRRGGVHGKVA